MPADAAEEQKGGCDLAGLGHGGDPAIQCHRTMTSDKEVLARGVWNFYSTGLDRAGARGGFLSMRLRHYRLKRPSLME